jgi:hypothetical protein
MLYRAFELLSISVLFLFHASLTRGREWSSELHSLWPVLIETVNITTDHGGPEDTLFSDRISDEAVRMWRKFQSELEIPPDQVNDRFFRYQLDLYENTHGRRAAPSPTKDPHTNVTWPALEGLPEYQRLRRYIEQFGRRYLERIGYKGPTKFNIFSWAAVHSFGDFHGAHTHTGELLVGVYYARINERSGRLRLFDPRGQIVPFGKTFDFDCRTGQMILFPSWLQHEALPTKDEGHRVIFAFNIGIAGEGDLKSMDWGKDPVSGFSSTTSYAITDDFYRRMNESSPLCVNEELYPNVSVPLQ